MRPEPSVILRNSWGSVLQPLLTPVIHSRACLRLGVGLGRALWLRRHRDSRRVSAQPPAPGFSPAFPSCPACPQRQPPHSCTSGVVFLRPHAQRCSCFTPQITPPALEGRGWMTKSCFLGLHSAHYFLLLSSTVANPQKHLYWAFNHFIWVPKTR